MALFLVIPSPQHLSRRMARRQPMFPIISDITTARFSSLKCPLMPTNGSSTVDPRSDRLIYLYLFLSFFPLNGYCFLSVCHLLSKNNTQLD